MGAQTSDFLPKSSDAEVSNTNAGGQREKIGAQTSGFLLKSSDAGVRNGNFDILRTGQLFLPVSDWQLLKTKLAQASACACFLASVRLLIYQAEA